jgi:hypothetical protein
MVKNIIIGALVVLIAAAGAWYYVSNVAHTPIGKVVENPRAYDGKDITISGQVTDRASLLFVKYFQLKDNTGEITVVTNRVLPSVGAKVRVKGHVEQAFAMGDKQMLVFVEGSGEKKKDNEQ